MLACWPSSTTPPLAWTRMTRSARANTLSVLRAFVGDGPVTSSPRCTRSACCRQAAPSPGQLAGLCARLGIAGHGITAPPAGDLPDRW
jgi:hypothetical protein